MSRPSLLKWAAVAIVAIVLIAGCATWNGSSYALRGFDARQYRTYAWGPADALSTGDPRLDNNRFFEERVRAQVDAGLRAHGFEQEAILRHADLLVHYHASVTQRIDVSEVDRNYPYRSEPAGRPFVFDAGTLFIDLVDPRTNTLVWRGWVEGSLQGVIDDQALMEARIDEAVARILRRLPRALRQPQVKGANPLGPSCAESFCPLANSRWYGADHPAVLIGLGLTFAAITNTCAMAELLMQMPWNRRLI